MFSRSFLLTVAERLLTTFSAAFLSAYTVTPLSPLHDAQVAGVAAGLGMLKCFIALNPALVSTLAPAAPAPAVVPADPAAPDTAPVTPAIAPF